jgi:uncharacterized protein (TIGR02145 family)
MKKHALLLVACCVAAASFTAQAQDKKLQVVLKSGTTVEYNMTDIDYLSFSTPEVTPPTTEKQTAYCFDVPDDFSQNRILKVVADGKKIAEICCEYVLACNDMLTVVYPMGEDDKADLTKGIDTENGGSVVWDASTNKATIGEGSGHVSQIYIVDGELQLTAPEGYEIVTPQILPDYLYDTRYSASGVPSTIAYKTTKVGTQYWMAENLRAQLFTNGTEIPSYKAEDTSSWTANTTGARHAYADNEDLVSTYGYLYNGYAVASESGLAPEGWEVPTRSQWIKLRTASNKSAANLKAEDTIMWGTSYDAIDTTGFTAYPCGYYSTATGDNAETEAWWWTSTSYYDFLTRSNAYDFARMTSSGDTLSISNSAGHSYEFGHAVRCVRK